MPHRSTLAASAGRDLWRESILILRMIHDIDADAFDDAARRLVLGVVAIVEHARGPEARARLLAAAKAQFH